MTFKSSPHITAVCFDSFQFDLIPCRLHYSYSAVMPNQRDMS